MKDEIINGERFIDGERVIELSNGGLFRPDRFCSSSMEGITIYRDGEIDPDDITDDELREVFAPELLESAGIPAKAKKA